MKLLFSIKTVHFLGMPEGDLALGQLAVYLALAPKSDSTYRAMNKVHDVIANTAAEPVPLSIRNAPTRLMKDLGYSAGYEHAHLDPEALTAMTCLPDSLAGMRFYEPSERGFEQKLRERMAWLNDRKRERRERD